MGLIGSFFRLVAGLVIFIAVLVLGIVFSSQLGSFFQNFPGTVTINNVEVPVLASILASVVLTVVLNLALLPFRRREL
jgi:amino acid permease